MKRLELTLAACLMMSSSLCAQEFYDAGGEFTGAGSVGSSEQLFEYDDQENWKHGYLKVMPYYHGFHSFRPYNYHHVFGQSSTAQGFGMSPVMPYSQQFWHRYEHMTDLSQGNHEPVFPAVPPVQENNHYPRPIDEAALPTPVRPSAQSAPQIQNYPAQGAPIYQSTPAMPNYTQIFYGAAPQQPIAPVQYQNGGQQIGRPTLPAPGYQY